MQYKKKSITSAHIKDKKVLLRCDFNVPLDKDGCITDDTRIKAALPTINYILEQGGAVNTVFALGRAKGEARLEFSLKPVSKRLGEYLTWRSGWLPNDVGETAKSMAAALKHGEVMLLGKLRFHRKRRKTTRLC
jgi:3-phosphoglycerate kinase